MTARKRYWLMKSEPDAFSIDDLERVGIEPWNGVRNYQARNFMRDGMQVGDGVLFYHSNTQVPGIVGVASVASRAYPDETQFDPKSHYHDPKATREQPRWFLVDVKFERKLKRTISLEEVKQHADGGAWICGICCCIMDGPGICACGVALPYMRLNIDITSISAGPVGGSGGFGAPAPFFGSSGGAPRSRWIGERDCDGIMLRRVRCSLRYA